MELLGYSFLSLGLFAYLLFVISPIYSSGGLIGEMRGFLHVFVSVFLIFGESTGIVIGILSLILNASIFFAPVFLLVDLIYFASVWFVVLSLLAIGLTIWGIIEEESSEFYWQFYLWPISFVFIATGFNLLK